MENFSHDERLDRVVVDIQQSFLTKVYGWMTLGLLVTAFASFFLMSTGLYVEVFRNRMVFYVMLFGELGLVWYLASRISRLSSFAAVSLFMLYSALTGATLSVILVLYTAESVTSIFFTTAGMFAAMSAYGYITKRDLTGVGQFMMMGLIGVIIASIVNIFIGSADISWVISFITVIIFTGLTAYDTQKLKSMAVATLDQGGISTQASILGALTLYLDFINLFLALLRLFGRRR
jgi:hypothetical protein